MKLISLFAASLFILTSNLFYSNAFGQIVINKDSVSKSLMKLKDEKHVKALLAGIWIGEKEILSEALGESMTSVPAALEMNLRIGGVSEIFLGTLLMMLVDQGKISLSDRASKWLPDLLAADKVTIGMLIKNTAGYKDYVVNKDFLAIVEKHPFRNISREEIINFATNDGVLNFTPGTDQKYSHTEFTILGQILERATGKKMYELYEENIFKPLGLEHTGYSTTPDLPYPVLHAFSSSRDIYEDATFWNPSWTGDSGPLYSNLPELGKWAYIYSVKVSFLHLLHLIHL